MNFHPGKNFFLYLPNFAALLFLLNLSTPFLQLPPLCPESLMGDENEVCCFCPLDGKSKFQMGLQFKMVLFWDRNTRAIFPGGRY